MGSGLSGWLLRARQKGGLKTEGSAVGLTRKGKGTKWMMAVDGQGIPLGVLLASAQVAEIKLAQSTLETIRVRQARGRPRTRPAKVTCDRAYDSRELRAYLRKRGIACCIPARRRPKEWKPKRGRPTLAKKADYAKRWIVERTFAHLGNYRRLLIRWERHLSIYRAFFMFAIALICINQLLK
jgi:transposase